MSAAEQHVILNVDDDPFIRSSVSRILERTGYRVFTASDGAEALKLVESVKPNLCLLDVHMPGMDGYELCERLRRQADMASVPMLFLTVFSNQGERDRAFAAGADGVLEKPFDLDELIEIVGRHTEVETDGSDHLELGGDGTKLPSTDLADPTIFAEFKKFLQERLITSPVKADFVTSAPPEQLYGLATALGVSERELAAYVADFLSVPYVAGIEGETVDASLLAGPFCIANLVVPTGVRDGSTGVIVSNPFDWGLLETLRRTLEGEGLRVSITEPDSIRAFFTYGEGATEGDTEVMSLISTDLLTADDSVLDLATADDGFRSEVTALANEVLRRAVSEKASDIHIEPKRRHASIRFRVDGDLMDIRTIPLAKCGMLIARFKALGRMDIAERRKPQDGALEAVIHGRQFRLRLSTTRTPNGESMVVRLIEPSANPMKLTELGMTEDQSRTMLEFAAQSHGLVIIVGPTGSGKSTTIFSLLSTVDGDRRSLMTVEDPVEYRIPFANQQQIDERAGATFESLLKAAVRQDPDILLIGEVRDRFSANAAMEFAGSGHMTVTSLHSSNATTAIFRLERLGVQRGAMADVVLGVVAQKLMKKLCERCKSVRPITPEEREILAPFTKDSPDEVADPVGCPSCRQTGYNGREAVYEILHFDRDIKKLVRDGTAISDIRALSRARGDFQICHHAVDKVRDLTVPVDDAYRHVLIEEGDMDEGGPVVGSIPDARSRDVSRPVGPNTADSSVSAPDERRTAILVVEDDPATLRMLERFLEEAGHDVTVATDGADALMQLGSARFDLVVSDIHMPNLDGFTLLGVINEKNLDIPVAFVTADTDSSIELQALEAGAADFLFKPITKEIFNLRVARILKRGAA